MEEYRVFGPPGTGKTTYLTQQIEKALKKYFPRDILVASFTRAGAITVASRTDALPRENIGTLHAFCFRALGQPEIAEKHIKEFNELHPEYAVGYDDQNGDLDDPFAVVDTKNNFMLVYQTMRAKLIPRDNWDIEVLQFADAWEDWCNQSGYTDLTGLIERGIKEIPCAPGEPNVAFFDEVQDFTRLEMSLVDKWSTRMKMVVKVGDDDQMIYSFKGATTDSFNGNIDADHKIYLKQSWRLPKEIVDYSARWINQIQGREPKPYFSERSGGFVKRMMATFKMPSVILDEVSRLNEEGSTCMIITSCGYMLDNIKAAMFDRGIPWCNPYKPKRGDWNPLILNRGRGISSLQRFVDYMTISATQDWTDLAHSLLDFDQLPSWSHTTLASILEILDLSKMGFKRGCKAAIKKLKEEKLTQYEWFAKFLPDDSTQATLILEGLCFPTVEWIRDNVLPDKYRALKIAFQVVEKGGSIKSLEERPKNIIGTIHSVKGGEADYVFLAPDVSSETAKQTWMDGEDKDSVTRLFYVGMTRARHGLYLLQPATYKRIEFLDP